MNGNNQQSPQGPRSPYQRPPGGFNLSRIAIIVLILLAVFMLPFMFNLCSGAAQGNQISYSVFLQQVRDDNVSQVVIQGQKITGTFKNPSKAPSAGQGGQQPPAEFITYVPSFGDSQLMPLLEQHNVQITAQPASNISWLSILLTVVPFVFLIWIFYSFYRRMGSQGQNIFSMGQSQAKRYEKKKESTTFEDVAGIRSAKEELHEIVDYLKDPGKYRKIGAQIPRGVLLVGPPGSGKTLLARAVAGEANVPFYSITGSDFMEMFVGVGASRVRNLFRDAKRSSPAIIFIDELDSIGRHRGAGVGGGHDEREQTLNQLLSEMDGFEPHESVIVMAATNRPDILDPALLRPGRFDRRVTVDLPTMKDREEILKIHARGKPLAEDLNFEEVAKSTPGFSGADLENLLNEAALITARKEKRAIGRAEIDEAYDKILLGLERTNMVLSAEDKRILSYHESGHALLAALLPHADPIHKVTIIPRSHTMGVTQQLPERDRYIYDKEYLLDRLAVMMGGRAAEDLKGGSLTSGAESDLKEATSLARKMVLDWGMSDRLQHLALGTQRREVFLGEEIGHQREYSEETAREIDEEVAAILTASYQRAHDTLKQNEGKLDALAKELLEKEELPGKAVIDIVGAKQKQPEPESTATP
jgi:cell division protease FtsH